MEYQNTKHDLLQINLFSHLDNQKDIFFSKIEYLNETFAKIRDVKNNVILISGNSDREINDTIIGCAPKNIKYWLTQNANSEKILGIPIGLENQIECKLKGHGVAWKHAIEKHKYISNQPCIAPEEDVYANFSISTNFNQRNAISKLCQSIDYITCDIFDHHAGANSRSFYNYISQIKNHHMTICPPGNGIDCHRMWEVLYLNRVPIVQQSTVMNHFSDLPILYIQDWNQLNDKEYIFSEYNRVKNNNKQKLQFKYWESLVLSLRNNL